MSTTAEPMSLSKARELALMLVENLGRYCDRIEIAGSIRRGKDWINDIEVVCIPKVVPVEPVTDLFGKVSNPGEKQRDPNFVEVIRWFADTIVKGQPATAKYIQFLTRTGVKVDVFTATPDNWGYILAIRTGSAEFSKGLAHRWKKLGYEGIDGMLTRFGKPVSLKEERDLFNLLQLPWVPPSERA